MADLEINLFKTAVQKVYDQILTSGGVPRQVKLHSGAVNLKARAEGKDITLLKFDTSLTLDKLTLAISDTGAQLEVDTTFKFSSLEDLTGNDGKVTVNVDISYNETEGKIEFYPSTAMLPIRANFFGSPVLHMLIPLQLTLLKMGLPVSSKEFSFNPPRPFEKSTPILVKIKKAVTKCSSDRVALEIDIEAISA